MEVLSSVGLEVVRWETTVRCSTHYFTLLRRRQLGELGQDHNRKLWKYFKDEQTDRLPMFKITCVIQQFLSTFVHCIQLWYSVKINEIHWKQEFILEKKILYKTGGEKFFNCWIFLWVQLVMQIPAPVKIHSWPFTLASSWEFRDIYSVSCCVLVSSDGATDGIWNQFLKF